MVEEDRRKRLLAILNKSKRSAEEKEELGRYLLEIVRCRRRFYQNLGNADWDDVVSTSIEELLLECDGSKPMSSLVTFFHRKLHFRALDRIRKNKGQEKTLEGDDPLGESSSGFGGKLMAADLLTKALQRLRNEEGERAHAVLLLRLSDKLSAKDVAEQLGLTSTNVNKILSRARAAMQAIIRELESGTVGRKAVRKRGGYTLKGKR